MLLVNFTKFFEKGRAAFTAVAKVTLLPSLPTTGAAVHDINNVNSGIETVKLQQNATQQHAAHRRNIQTQAQRQHNPRQNVWPAGPF